MTSRIPPLLEPYLSLPPEASLILLTNVLGASTNWLVLRYLYSALAVDGSDGADGGAKVVLVSFLRDLAFWKDGARRLGLDLARFVKQKRFAFVDGLTGLFIPLPTAAETDSEAVIKSSELAKVYEDIWGAIRALQNGKDGQHDRKLILVIDALDFLLAASEHNIGPVEMGEMLMDLREHVHATVLTLSDDSPLALRQQTPLETNHAAFLLNVAHQADLIMSLRMLDTGTARDVSGVIRVAAGRKLGEDETGLTLEGMELLYFVGGDGNVKAFERGQ